MRTCHVLSTLLVMTTMSGPRLVGAETAPAAAADAPPAEETPPTAEETPEGGEASGVAAEEAPEAPATIEDHVAALSSRDQARRIAAARALGATGDTSVAEPLIAVLATEPRPEVRAWVVRSIAELGSAAGQEAIVRVAHEDPDERVRSLAARLAGMPSPPVVGVTTPVPAPAEPAVRLDYGDPTPAELAARRRPGRPGRGFAISGWATFGSVYLTCFIAGVTMMGLAGPEFFWPLILPGIGPGVLAGLLFADGWIEPIIMSICLIAMAAQVAGLVLLGIGHHRMREHRRATERRARRLQWAVLPTAVGDGPGLVAVGAF